MPTNVLVLNKSWVVTGAGEPEGQHPAPLGSIYLREEGAVGTSFYIKESGSGTTGWKAVGAPAVPPTLHHATHEPGGTDVLTVAAWTDRTNTFLAQQRITATSPAWTLIAAGAQADAKRFDVAVATDGSRFDILALTDAAVVTGSAQFSRLGNLVLSGALTTTALDLKEGVPLDPPLDTARLYSLDVNGYTQVEMRDGSAKVVRFASDNILIAKVTGVAVTRGQCLYLAGASGANPLAGLARADNSATMPAVGLALDSGAVNAFIRVLVAGTLQLLDTSAFAEGDRLYVSPTTAGAMTTTLPVAPAFAQRVGFVTRSHATQGEVLVLTTAVAGDPRLHHTTHEPGGTDVLQLTAGSRLLGRGASGAGAMEEIVLGSNLTLTGTTLNAVTKASTIVSYTYSSNITEPLTVAGQVRFNSLTMTAVTKVWMRIITVDLQDVYHGLMAVAVGSTLLVQDKDDHTIFAKFTTTGPPIDKTTYVEFPVAWVSNGTALANNQATLVQSTPPAVPATAPLHRVTHEPGGSDALTALSAGILTTGSLPFARVAVSAASKLLGRGASGAGAMEEIVLGTGLTMSGTTLNAAGSALPSNLAYTDVANTWTAAQNFPSASGFVNSNMLVNFRDTTAPANASAWRIVSYADGYWSLETMNDAFTTTQARPLILYRTGNLALTGQLLLPVLNPGIRFGTTAASGALRSHYPSGAGVDVVTADSPSSTYAPLYCSAVVANTSGNSLADLTCGATNFQAGVTVTAGGANITGLVTMNSGCNLTGTLTVNTVTVNSGALTVNPGVTNLYGRVTMFGGTTGNYGQGPLEIQMAGNPRIGFHWPGVIASQLGMDSGGTIRTFDNPGTGYAAFQCAGLYATSGSFSANIACWYVEASAHIRAAAGLYDYARATPIGGWQVYTVGQGNFWSNTQNPLNWGSADYVYIVIGNTCIVSVYAQVGANVASNYLYCHLPVTATRAGQTAVWAYWNTTTVASQGPMMAATTAGGNYLTFYSFGTGTFPSGAFHIRGQIAVQF